MLAPTGGGPRQRTGNHDGNRSDGNGDRSNRNDVNCDRSSAAEVPSRKCRDRILTSSQKCREKCRAKVPRKVPRYVVEVCRCTETAAAARRAPEGAQRPSGRGRRRAVEGKPAQRAQRQRESRAILRGSLRRARAAILRPGAREQGRYPAALRLSRAALSCAARCRAAQRCR